MLKTKLNKGKSVKTSIAIVGAGVSGLTTAMLLSENYNITLYEINNYLGGHAKTLEKKLIQEKKTNNISFDIGFLVYNNKNYPLFSNLLKLLKVKTVKSNMSFSVSNKKKNFEYASNSIMGLTDNLKNIFRLDFWVMLKDIKLFYKSSKKILTSEKLIKNNDTVKSFLDDNNFSTMFINEHFLPMCGAIWSISFTKVLNMPIKTILIFFNNHGLLSFFGKPKWRTIDGGSKNYVNKMKKNIKGKVYLKERVIKVKRYKNSVLIISKNYKKRFDKIIFATHPDDTFKLINKPDKVEKKILSNYKYESNTIYVHQDKSLMPKNKNVWSSWNVISYGSNNNKNICVTYWINKLQNIKTLLPILVTLNANANNLPNKNRILKKFYFRHPIFNKSSYNATSKINLIQGKNNTYYVGAWLGYGFHEDGVKSAYNLMEYFKIKHS